MTPIDRADTEERLARLEQTIEEYRADQRRLLLQQVTKFRRLAKAHKAHEASAALAEPPTAH